MRMFKLIPAALVACSTLISAAHAASITLDFEAVGDGAIVTDGSSSTGLYTGITISALNVGGGPNTAVAYDSEGAIGRDNDLEENRFSSNFVNGATDTGGITGFGNLLIVQENSIGCTDGVCDRPDDEAGGGFLRFGFEQSHFLRSFDYFDIDGSPNQQAETFAVKLFTNANFDWEDAVDGTDVLLVDGLLSTGGDNTFRTHTLSGLQFVYGVEFAFSSSGAIDNIVLDPVSTSEEVIPEPATLLIFLSGLFCIAIMARRKLCQIPRSL